MIPRGLAMAEPVAVDVPLDTFDETVDVPLDTFDETIEAPDLQPSKKAVECFAHGIAHVVDELGTAEAVRWTAQVIMGLAEADGETAP